MNRRGGDVETADAGEAFEDKNAQNAEGSTSASQLPHSTNRQLDERLYHGHAAYWRCPGPVVIVVVVNSI